MTRLPSETIKQNRRQFASTAALGIAAAGAAILLPSNGEAASANDAIRPFHIDFPESALADLHHRLAQTRLPEKETVTDYSQGVPLNTVQHVLSHWKNNYDWRKVEALLNSYPQFLTEIDGLDIHFMHVRSKHENALPLIVTHGWPGSIIEQLKIIGPLTDPTAYGGSVSDAFHLVIPSIPGYGFSGKPTTTGWDPAHIARAWNVLMKRLNYTKYVAQGGDWGALITEAMAVQAPPGLIGMHTNLALAVPVEISKMLATGGPAPVDLSTDEKHAYDRLDFFFKTGLSYALEMGSRPQTLYGLADSPVALASWLLDHDALSLEMISRSFAGKSEGLTPDDILDNLTLTWLTNTGVSSGRLYWENKGSFFDPRGVSIPVAVSVFPDEIYAAPRSWVEKAYPKLVHYNKLDKGGHFAAWEQPKIFCEELRSGFRTVRQST